MIIDHSRIADAVLAHAAAASEMTARTNNEALRTPIFTTEHRPLLNRLIDEAIPLLAVRLGKHLQNLQKASPEEGFTLLELKSPRDYSAPAIEWAIESTIAAMVLSTAWATVDTDISEAYRNTVAISLRLILEQYESTQSLPHPLATNFF